MYRQGFEQVVVNDEERPTSLCVCYRNFIQTRPNIFVKICWRYGNSSEGYDTEDEKYWDIYHTTFFQLTLLTLQIMAVLCASSSGRLS